MSVNRLLGGGSWFPNTTFFGALPPAFVGLGRQIDASGEKMGFLISVPKTGTIESVEFRCAGVSQNPGSNGIRISLQDVSLTTGNPDETQDQFRDILAGISSGAWVNPGKVTSDGTDNGTLRSVTKGQLLAVVWEFVSFQSGSDFTISLLDAAPSNPPYFCHKTGGSWSKESYPPVIGLR